MTGAHHIGQKWHTCTDCGKRAYGTRRDAKTALRNHPTPTGMHVYRCAGSGLWHFGHNYGLPRATHRRIERRRRTA